MRYQATGALTVVISPLVALMADQVTAMRRQGITCATTINGLISMPERAEALAHIRLGDAGIVLVAPEQLRRVFSTLEEIGVASNELRITVYVHVRVESASTRRLALAQELELHRIAYLVRVRRENPGSTLAPTYNRHAAVEARRRLDELIGSDARGVNVMTCHALAMRILGISFAETAANPGDETFDNILRAATRLLRSDQTTTFVTREQMLGRLHWILVDEYQDIGEPEYELISALAGKTLADDDARLNLFAVGDDDQNIYAWKGASVRYIRRFARDYRAKEEYLVENYRSSGFIIDAANRCIEGAAERLKRDHRLRVDSHRVADPPGGPWTNRDGLAEGRVQILHLRGGQLSQAVAAVEELQRLSKLDPDWQWSRCAVIARNWEDLDPVRSACMVRKIPVQSAREELSSFWRARETQKFLTTLEAGGSTTIETAKIRHYRTGLPEDPWAALLAQALEELMLEESHAAVLPTAFVRNWLGEWSREIRRRQPGAPLSLVREDGQWRTRDHARIQVGRMARRWSPPAGMAIERAVVHGIFTRWAKDEVDKERRQRLRCETWEVVVPKL